MDDKEFIKWFKSTLYGAIAKELVAANEFVEAEHPRDKIGRFTRKGNRSSTGVDKEGKSFWADEIKGYPGQGYTNKNLTVERCNGRSFLEALDEFYKHRKRLKSLSNVRQLLLFELLMRGYNINPKKKNTKTDYSNTKQDGHTFISNKYYRNPKVLNFKNKDEALEYLNSSIAPKGRYVLAYSKKNSTDYDECEIVEIFKNDKQELRFFNVSEMKIYDESLLDDVKYIDKYNGRERFENLQLFRIDNQEFNPKFIKQYCKKTFHQI